jgi:hypothetical protein
MRQSPMNTKVVAESQGVAEAEPPFSLHPNHERLVRLNMFPLKA